MERRNREGQEKILNTVEKLTKEEQRRKKEGRKNTK